MKLVMAIVRKDFWRLRWLLVVWLTVVALRLGVGFSVILSDGTSGVMFTSWYPNIAYPLMGLGLLLTWVLTAMLVQEDLLVGSTQFWVTRPISAARLLVGKLVGWLLMLWLPAVVLTLPWWLTCGFGPREIALAALELLLWQAVVSLPAAFMAAVTDTFSRFLVWSFVLLFALITLPVPAANILEKIGWMKSTTDLIYLSSVLMALALVLAGVVARQFLRRNVVRSLGWFALGVALTPFAGVFGWAGWLNLSQRESPWTDWHAERASGVSLELRDYYIEGGKKPLDDVRLHSVLEVHGLPDDLALDAGDGGKQTWRWQDQPAVTRDGNRGYWWANVGDDERGVRSALGGIARPKPDEETVRYEAQRRAELVVKFPHAIFHTGSLRLPVGVEISEELMGPTFTRIKQTPPAYEASVRLRLLRPELWTEVPLQASGWHAHAAHGFRVGALTAAINLERPADAQRDPNRTYYAPLVATLAEFFWDTQPRRSWSAFDWNGAGLFIVNRAGGDMWRQHVRSGPTLTISSVSIQRSTMQLWQPTVRRGDKWVLRDPNWLAGATVAMIGFREEARFTAEAKAERFEPAK